jgi:hypothetical protein
MLWLHKPWRKSDCKKGGAMKVLLADKERTIQTFLTMMDEPGRLPMSVINQYRMARKYSREAKIELVARQGLQYNQEIDESKLDGDELDQYLEFQHSSHKTDNMKQDEEIGRPSYDLGREYDWTTLTFNAIRDIMTRGQDWLLDNQERYYEEIANDKTHGLEIPTKNGKRYCVADLTEEQKAVVLGAVDAVVKFLTNDEDYKPFRATVSGFGGTGKSFIINTIITVIRELTNCNSTVKVAAPSGSAAFNVRGCTIHRLLKIDPSSLHKQLSAETLAKMKETLKNLLVLMIDERSMISSELMCSAEKNLRQTVFGGQNSKEFFGGLPVVILFGDDYQLPPVRAEGVIKGFMQFKKRKGSSAKNNGFDNSSGKMLARHRGDMIFINHMTENVFELTKNLRVTEESEDFQDTLQRLRVAEQNCKDTELLLRLNISQEGAYTEEFIQKLNNDPKTLYVYATNEPRMAKNRQKLQQISRQFGVPVARIHCHYESNRPNDPTRLAQRNHFTHVKFVRDTDISLHSTVSLKDNFIPEWGLFNGARGKVVEMIFKNPEGPNDKQHKHLPEYVVVDFPGLILPSGYEPWDKNHPTVSVSILCMNDSNNC